MGRGALSLDKMETRAVLNNLVRECRAILRKPLSPFHGLKNLLNKVKKVLKEGDTQPSVKETNRV